MYSTRTATRLPSLRAHYPPAPGWRLHGWIGRDAFEQRVVKAAAAQRQVRLAVGRAHGG
jgi:hypothetical protein